jgi:8-oxo-dGTP diphosphatase
LWLTGRQSAPEFHLDLALWCAVQTERTMPLIIVGAAIILDGRVLACERAEPPEMSGKWEFPGGKVEPGEGEAEALVRECEEELGIVVEVGERVGSDIALNHGNAILKVYQASLTNGRQPTPLEHSDLRWLSIDELNSVPWLPADAPIVDALRPFLTA